jgi:glycerate-2-kinase
MLEKLFLDGLHRMNPAKRVREILEQSSESPEDDLIRNLATENKIYIIGSGKASYLMASGAVEVLGNRIADGMIIAPELPALKLNNIQTFKGSHPLPDSDSLAASYELLDFIKRIPENSLVLNLLSGGTSALLCIPANDLDIEEVAEICKQLILSGADIHEINSVRRVFSAVKAGRLLSHLSHTRLVDLIISDVPDDDLHTIGSGPTMPGTASPEEAFHVLKRYRLWDTIPHEARAYLAKQLWLERENPSAFTTKEIAAHSRHIIASAPLLAQQIKEIAEEKGFNAHCDSATFTGSVEGLKKHILSKIDEQKGENRLLIFYGESTVNVKGDGKGGRNQELALEMALALQGRDGIQFLSAGSDGIDGPTDAAGAIVSGETADEAGKKGLDINHYLENNDSYNFFDQFGGHLKTGATGNNLMDIQLVHIR